MFDLRGDHGNADKYICGALIDIGSTKFTTNLRHLLQMPLDLNQKSVGPNTGLVFDDDLDSDVVDFTIEGRDLGEGGAWKS
jgi:hypothetical protein